MKNKIDNLTDFLSKSKITDLNYQGFQNVSVALSYGKLVGFVIKQNDEMFFVDIADARKEIEQLQNVDTNWQITQELLSIIYTKFTKEDDTHGGI